MILNYDLNEMINMKNAEICTPTANDIQNSLATFGYSITFNDILTIKIKKFKTHKYVSNISHNLRQNFFIVIFYLQLWNIDACMNG
jgi:hypothetical protein